MATEKRLIDAGLYGEFLHQYAEDLMEMDAPMIAGAIGRCLSYLDAQPTVDAVEVVRCGKCSYYEDGKCFHPKQENGWNSAGGEHLVVKISDFCSYGERKDNG